ncbi:MAG: hypothetical protein PHP69_07295 [Candidatus Omnitrophica bacterium]|nr:hypothetical protein [Candidatus Omnitrophota bacterium]MDD5081151.1 hypothetical protein [Candidatus Omnitrophota bacterium]MDD5441692.1 hypothetical protein [Candidatus Omnitrophota bacterium]
MELYKRPKITAIKLDNEQAVLAVCQSENGIWLAGTGNAFCVHTTGMTTTVSCASGFRGTGINAGMTTHYSVSPGS